METKDNQDFEVTITISKCQDFICDSDWTVQKAENRIRSMYLLEGGGIQLGKKALDPDLPFKQQLPPNHGILSFVNAISCQKSLFLNDYSRNTIESVYRPTYKRYEFTTPPVFGDDFIVGNLNTIASLIETHILSSMNSGRDIKENYPFHCLINPPRHGKSLLLDRVFMNNENVIVIGITYNSTTGLIEDEIDSPQSAIKWFWIRVLKSMLQITDQLKTLSNLLQYEQCSWRDIKSLIIKGLSSNPFIDNNGNEKNILFCIDEFSLLTDELQHWEKVKQKQFISELHQMKQASYPFLQFVMTGFHISMNTLLESSSIIQWYALEFCNFSTSRPLLKRIHEEYNNSLATGEAIQFPLFLFEIVRSTPGLIGVWAEYTSKHNFCNGPFDFANRLPWIHNVTNSEFLRSNWLLVFDYLIYLIDEDFSLSDAIGESIVAAEIGIMTPVPEIIPLCFVIIVCRAQNCKLGETPLQTVILEQLTSLFHKFKLMAASKQKEGVIFETLVVTALYIRLLLWVQKKSKNITEQRIRIPFRSFLPISCSESFVGYHPFLGSRFSVHMIHSKESLQKLLLPPLYNIFPLGISSLEEKWDYEISSTLSSFIESDHTKKTYNLQPLETNPEIDISSKFPSQKKQSIICKVSGYQIADTLSFEIFNQMKSGADVDQINVLLNNGVKDEIYQANDVEWWKRLQCLVKQLYESIEDGHSLILTADNAEAADLLIVWKQTTFDSSENIPDIEIYGLDQEVIHVATLELKDRRQTPLVQWQMKWNSLMSPSCILHWMPLFFSKHFSIHFTFVAREHA